MKESISTGCDQILVIGRILHQVMPQFFWFVHELSILSILCLHQIYNPSQQLSNSFINTFVFLYHNLCFFYSESQKVNLLTNIESSYNYQITATLRYSVMDIEMDRNMVLEERPIEALLEQVDLISSIELHKCRKCYTPLSKFTKVVARIASEEDQSENQAWKMFCLPCFSQWSSYRIDRQRYQPLSRKYIVCKRTDQPERKLENWSVDEIYWLLHLTKSGFLNKTTLQKQFTKRTGTVRTEKQLQDKQMQLAKKLIPNRQFQNLSIDLKNEEVPPSFAKDTSKIKEILQLETSKEEQRAEMFMKAINHQHLTQYKRCYPDNHEDFMAKVIATSSTFKERLGIRHETSSKSIQEQFGAQKLMEILVDQLSKKDQNEQKISTFLSQMCEKYAKVEKVEKMQGLKEKKDAREKRKLQQRKKLEKEISFAHPEFESLKKIPEVEQELAKVFDLKEKRRLLLEQAKSCRK